MVDFDQNGFSDRATELQNRAPANARAIGFELKVVRGPDIGLTFQVDSSQPVRALVGQSQACSLRLSDRLVSRRHAALEVRGHELRLTDLGSTNGTMVNGLCVYEAALEGGESIRFGETVVDVRRIGTASPAETSESDSFGIFYGASIEMRRLYPLCERLAASKVPVVIEGETGTGKEVLAESLHQMGPRANKPFIVFDCTAVPPNLVESALFGHVRGAFTGASNNHTGMFEEADGGTLLIDEIGDLDITLQPKLLRALERGEIRRVGGDRWYRVDVRVLAATRRDLDKEVQAGRFRDDLFFRLAVARIELPPLRQRSGDIEQLTSYFWKRLGGLESPPRAMIERFLDYSWPGNVRELQNTISRFIALGDLAKMPGDLDGQSAEGDYIQHVLGLDLPLARARALLVEEFERKYLKRVLDQNGGSIARAAAASGVARRYFQLLRAKRNRVQGDRSES